MTCHCIGCNKTFVSTQYYEHCDDCNATFQTKETPVPCPKNCPLRHYPHTYDKETPVTPDDNEQARIYRDAYTAEREHSRKLENENARLREENEKLKDFYSSFENSYAKMVGKLNSIKHIVES